MAKEHGAQSKQSITGNETKECFIIMPISDPDGYEVGHFARVYNDIIEPACVKAGYYATRADQVKETNLIHVDILKRLLDAPMAICDLSSRNPNVLFELGIRQAFDKPVVLIQEKNTPRIFDISPLRAIDYKPELKYREVLTDQDVIAEAIIATANIKPESGSINSLIQLLSLSAAKLSHLNPAETENAQMQLLREEVSQMKNLINKFVSQKVLSASELLISSNEIYTSLVNEYLNIEQSYLSKNVSVVEIRNSLVDLQMRLRLHNKRESSTEVKNRLNRLDKELVNLLAQIKSVSGSAMMEEPPF
ncbi:hypothetical protein HHL22_00275 [Hymenobacter sp. RP-2-7]|uniref:Uncharacterized protein n=1 Tax=Hymenobacter polaris TaxID=2682546 RepID=A0A7Y0AA85_9BACT|nr:hypothetical protein [Hymenobacter polaris]NML63636.1 hypothetical protein [Hymenobacter polaris]